MGDPASELVAAIAAQDWERLEACFTPEVAFRALVPSQRPFREHATAHDAAAQLAAWFGDADPLELLDSSVQPVEDVVRIAYRLGSFEEGRWYVVEQQLYATVEDDRIARLDLVCSGFRPVDRPPSRSSAS